MTLLKARGVSVINQFGYTYDKVGNRLTMTNKDGKVASYEYDKLYRLTRANYPTGSATTHTYDGVGNRLAMNGVHYTYDVTDRLLQAGNVTYQWDNNGNMIGKAGTRGHDYLYLRLYKQTFICGLWTIPTTDGYGRRVSRSVKSKGFGIPEPQYTEYLWDGTNVLCEFYQNKHNPLEYVYGNGQLISRDDLLWLKQADKIVVQDSHWYHQDGLGSVVNLTDANGMTKMGYEYDAFSEITEMEGQIGWKKNQYTFTGKPYDSACGMYYFGARWYDAEAWRFGSKDLYTWSPNDQRVVGEPSSIGALPFGVRNYNPLTGIFVEPNITRQLIPMGGLIGIKLIIPQGGS